MKTSSTSLLEKAPPRTSTKNQHWHFPQGQKDQLNQQTKSNKWKKSLKAHANNSRMDLNVNKFANLIINTEVQSNQSDFQRNIISVL